MSDHPNDDQRPFPFDPDDDPTARLLRRALAEEAEMVQPSNGLDDITRRVEHEHRGRRFAPWLAGIAVAAVAGVVAGVLLTGDKPGQQAGPPAGQPTASVSATEPSGSATDSASVTTTASAGELQGLPVYYIGQSKARFWLYREFRTAPDKGGYIESAVRAMTELEPLDPDYSTPWKPASRVKVTQSGKSLTVDLSADAFSGTGVGSEVAGLAIQQLVYTATAAASEAGTPADTVTITVDGKPSDVWGVVRVGEPTARADLVDVQAPTWVTSPQEGETLKAGDVKFTGYGTAFEATFLWEVRKRGGDVVAEGNTMGGSMGTFGEFTFTAKLQAGDYTVEVYQPDMSDGESPEGPRMFPDTKDFTVK
ncbi:MAG TPA: Gmad2 immunoglobulin-like domain-containing protein [Actinomycetales bacterium]|nr:Gmad2 immunoglobulin-like domain-containing protein [Actinomycetales bacterium]